MATTTPAPTDIDLDISARSFWAKPYEEREKTFGWLRANDPVSYHRPYESDLMPPDENTAGFWAVTKHADCREVSRDVSRFISGNGIVMEDFPYIVQVAAHSFLAMDGTEHRQQRGIAAQGFTPRKTRKIQGWVQQHAKDLVDEIIDRGEGDFADLFAKQFPGRIFAHFFGVEQDSEEQEILMDAAEKMLAWDYEEAAQGRDALTTHADEAMRIQDVALAVAEKRRVEPGDDVVTWVVQAEFEGRKLEDWEIASFFSLLGSAANDTTRHTTAHAVRLLTENPDQLALLLEDLEGRAEGAVEEVLRHACPVMHFRRTACVDTQLNGTDIKEGDKLVMWYCSGNRDDEVFSEPARFDILRANAREHLGFGAGGPHYCLGNALGREMVKAALIEIYGRMPDIHVSGEPEMWTSNFMHGVQKLPVQWTPPAKS